MKRGSIAVHAGLFANTFLALLKTGIGIFAHSPALLADGINSASDTAYGIVVSIFMKISKKPADKEHPYGHEQMESIAAVVVGAFVITTAIVIFFNSVDKVYDLLVTDEQVYTGAAVIALWAALFTIVFKLWLTVWTMRIGRQTRNMAVIALGHDHRNDIFASMAAAAGIYFGRMGHPWVDPMAGTVVSLLILHTGIEILRSSASDLMNTQPGKELSRQIRTILSQVDQIRLIEEIHAHSFGPYFVINLTIGVEGSLTVAEGDRIATKVETLLTENIEFVRRVHVHYHPVDQS
ncbi:MAG: cation diffusion facilitator family transporter [Thermodesulfobacteriota bacterium]